MLPSGLRYRGRWTGDNDKLDPASCWADRRHNAVWFCNDHVAIARAHENRHCSDAFAAVSGQPRASGEGWPELS